MSLEPSPQRKALDVNKYATKKTIAQGMLDIALLTANASQLKYILQVGQKHEFYTLMLGLITTSLILQVLVGILLLSLNFMRDCRLHLLEYKTSATYINHFTTAMSIAITAINLLISAFDPSLARFVSSIDVNNNELITTNLLKTHDNYKMNQTSFNVTGFKKVSPVRMNVARLHELRLSTSLICVPINLPTKAIRLTEHHPTESVIKDNNQQVSVAALNLILSRLDVRKYENEPITTVVNHIATGCAMFAMISDVVKMSFGLDPALSLEDYYRNENVTL